MTVELVHGNGLIVGLESGNVWFWRQAFWWDSLLVPRYPAVSSGIRYSCASHPCSHVFLGTVDLRTKRKKGGNQENPHVFLYVVRKSTVNSSRV